MSDETTEYNDEDKDRLISLPEAAEIYGFDRHYLAKLARNGRLKARKIGNTWITSPRNLNDYIKSRKKRGVYREDINPEE